MFAIIQTGGKQYQVTPKQILDIEKIEGKSGDKIIFDQVLLAHNGEDTQIGTPFIPNLKIEATINQQKKAEKINILRFMAKSRHRRRKGHRQQLTNITISDFNLSSKNQEVAPKATKKTASKSPKTSAKKTTKSAK